MNLPPPRNTPALARAIALAFAAALSLLATASAWADIVVRAELEERRVFVGQPFALDITIEGVDNVPAPTLPPIDGFEVSYVGGQNQSSSTITIVNGQRREFSEKRFLHRFQLVPVRPGELIIPAIDVTVEGKTYTTSPTQVRVIPPKKDDDVALWISVDNDAPYVGEPIRLRVTLGLRSNGVRLAFSVPGVTGNFEVVSGETPPPRTMETVFNVLGVESVVERGTKRENGVDWQTFSVERVIIPRRAGALSLGPATVDAEVVTQAARGFFDRAETRRAVVPSDAITVNVRPLPEKGRPATFNGLIGRYSISATATPLEVGVGDPINLEIRVTGPLPAAVPEPALERQDTLTGAFKVTSEEGSSAIEGRTRLFRRTLRVSREDVREIPPIELSFFDTRSGEYIVARSAPIPLTVRATRVITAADAQGQASGGASLAAAVEDRIGGIAFNYEGASLLADQSFDIGSILRSPLGLAVIAGPPAAYAAAGAIILLRRRAGSETPAQRRKRLMSEARQGLGSLPPSAAPVEAAATISAAVRKAVGARLGIAGEGLTARETHDVLSQAGLGGQATAARDLLEACDAALYGGLTPDRLTSLRDDAIRVVESIDRTSGGAA